MTNPFKGRAFGARASAPQFPQRRAIVRKKKGGKVPGMFLGGFFESTPAKSSSSSTSTTQFGVIDPGYNRLLDSVMGRALPLSEKPYEAYTGQGVVPLSADQQAAFGNVRGNQGNYQPFYGVAGQDIGQASGADPTGAGMGYLNQAGNMQNGTQAASPFTGTALDALSRASGADPTGAGMGYLNQAGNMTNGSQAASPFIGAASQTFPGAVDQYMSPYTDKVVNRIAELGNRNLTENVLPGVNDTFTGGSAAQFGRERHADITGRAIRDSQESILGQQAQALEQGYTTAGNLFNQDANRQAGLATTAGGLAQGDISQRAGLGTAAGNLTAQGANTGLQAAQTAGNLAGTTGGLAQGDISQRAGLGTAAGNLTAQGAATNIAAGQAQAGLGQSTQQSGLTDANALSAAGSQQQQQAQNEETWKYNQWQQQKQDPYNKLNWAQGVSQGWTLPTQTSNQSQSQSTSTAAQGSPFGQILGAGIGLLGAAGGVPALGSLFGGGGMAAAGTPGSPYYGPVNNGTYRAAEGGAVPDYAQGGMIPSITAMRKAMQQPKGMPTGMPGMTPMPTLAPQLPQGQPNGQPATPFANGGPVKGKVGRSPTQGPPRMSLEDQLDIFGKIIAGNSKANTGRGLLSPNPFLNDPNPELRYAQGGSVDDDIEQDVRMIVRAIHEHESNMHKGSPFTKLQLGG